MANANPFSGIQPVNPFQGLFPGAPAPTKSFSGNIPAGTPAVGDLFAALKQFMWRDVPFPVTEFEEDLVQGQVVHKYVDRDGAYVESTGRLPLRITARVPFINYIRRGRNETWPEQQLYPLQWRKLSDACADRTSGFLQHPERGILICKCENQRTRWSADVRGGVFVNLAWIESDDTANDLQSALSSPSPAASVFAAAQGIDAALASVSPLVVPTPYVPPTSFTDLANAVRGVSDQATLLQKQSAGRIDNLIYQGQALKDSLAGAANALNWPIVQMAEELIASAIVLKRQLLTQNARKILFHTATSDCSLAQIAVALKSPVGDIMTLNPGYVALGLVPQDAQVRYYSQQAA